MALPPDLWEKANPELRMIILVNRVSQLETTVETLKTTVETLKEVVEELQDSKTADKTAKENEDKRKATASAAWDKRLNYIMTFLLVVLPILVSVFVSQHGIVPVIVEYGLIGVGVFAVLVLGIRLIRPGVS